MLTKNFYKLLIVDYDCNFRQYSPSHSGSSGSSPFVDLINPSGKYICIRTPESADADKYEQVDLPSNDFRNSDSPCYTLGVSSTANEPKGSLSKASNTRTIVHNTNAFTSSKNVNEQVSTQETYPDGCGSLIMYIGNGTTPPTKDNYTMESCLTAYDRIGMITSQNFEAGLVTISYSVRPTEDIQLSEIGIFATKNTNYQTITMAPYKDTLMVCHDVFTPVTLQANKTTTITYTIDLSKLTAETTIG